MAHRSRAKQAPPAPPPAERHADYLERARAQARQEIEQRLSGLDATEAIREALVEAEAQRQHAARFGRETRARNGAPRYSSSWPY